MKIVWAALFGGAYMFAIVNTYSTLTYTNLCSPPERQIGWAEKTFSAALWPGLVVVAGFGSVLFGAPGIFACNSKHSKPYTPAER